jgi:hypothetical protein
MSSLIFGAFSGEFFVFPGIHLLLGLMGILGFCHDVDLFSRCIFIFFIFVLTSVFSLDLMQFLFLCVFFKCFSFSIAVFSFSSVWVDSLPTLEHYKFQTDQGINLKSLRGERDWFS